MARAPSRTDVPFPRPDRSSSADWSTCRATVRVLHRGVHLHGGHESTILTVATFATYHGMVIVPLGYSVDELRSTRMFGGPHGPTHRSPTDGSKAGLSDGEMTIPVAYEHHFAQIAAKLAAQRRASAPMLDVHATKESRMYRSGVPVPCRRTSRRPTMGVR